MSRRKRLFSLILILALMVSVLPVFNEPVSAASGQITVKYKFVEVTSGFTVGTQYVYITDTSGVTIDTANCLLDLPAGSGLLKVISGNSNGSKTYMDVFPANTYKSKFKAGTWDNSITVQHLVDVDLITSATGFDTCMKGGIGKTSNNRTTYFCNKGGCQNAVGHAYSYTQTTITKNDVKAVVRDGVEIDRTKKVKISSDDIIVTTTIDGQTYEVPEGVFTFTDDEIDIPHNDDEVTIKFDTISVTCKVHMHEWTYSQGDDPSVVIATCKDPNCGCHTDPVEISLDKPANCLKTNTNKEVTIEKDDEFPVNLGANDITYYLEDGVTKTNPENSGADGVGKPPKKEGNYVAKAKIDTYTIETPFTIGDIKVSVSNPTRDGFTVNWTYMGSDFKYMLDIAKDENFTQPVTGYNNYELPNPELEKKVINGLDEDETYYARVRLVNKSNSQAVSNSDPVEASPAAHNHKWDLKVEDKTIKGKCLTVDKDYKCPANENEFSIKIDVDESKKPSEDFIKITEDTSKTEGIKPKYKVLYFGTGDTTYGEPKGTTVKPTNPGTYKATLVVYRTKDEVDIDEKDSLKKPATTSVGFEIYDDGGVKKVKEKYIYRYPGKGINRGGGFIDYTPREDVLNFAHDGKTNEFVDGIYINMTKEKLVSNFAYDCYTTDGGKKWKKGKLEDAILSKAFSRSTNIRIANKYDEKTKKPGEGAEMYYFDTINKRPSPTTLKGEYQLYMDPYGITNGQWTLVKVTTEVPLYQYYEIGIGQGKKLGPKGFGIWPDAGGVWVPDLTKAGKATKDLYFYRVRATVNTPASKTKKVKVASVQARPKMKIDYKKELLKLKKGMSAFFGEKIPNLYEQEYDFENEILTDAMKTQSEMDGKYMKAATDAQAKGLAMAGYLTEDRNTVHLWINATKTKPATAVQTIVSAARGVITQKNLKVSKGKVVLDKSSKITYEFYDEGTQKWSDSLPAITGDITLKARVKCNVKGGKENGTNYATGIEGVCEIKWGVYDTKENKEGIISAILKPSK